MITPRGLPVVPEVKYKELLSDPNGELSEVIAKRVANARKRQTDRFRQNGVRCNAQMTPSQLRDCCKLDQATKKQLEVGIERLGFSARAYDRVLKVSRTIADLDSSGMILPEHIAEAMQYRSLDRNFWDTF